jgi:hypothetical protein
MDRLRRIRRRSSSSVAWAVRHDQSRIWGKYVSLAGPRAQINFGEQSDEAIQLAVFWIASRSLSSGAHSRNPLARNDGPSPNCLWLSKN